MKYIFIFLASLTCISAQAQRNVEDLVSEGIIHHDAGEYDKAIETYHQALNIEPESALVNYEISLTYMVQNNYDSAIKYSTKVLDINTEHQLSASVIYGNSLDALGKSKEALRVYEKALNKIGEHYMLYYNKAITLAGQEEVEESVDAVINALNLNKNHSSSHLLLGDLMQARNKKVPSILPLYFFLLLEPNSNRSQEAVIKLTNQIVGKVEETGSNEITINIDPSTLNKKNEFSSAELLIGMLPASNRIEKNKDKSSEELFIENTRTIFMVLGESKKKKHKGIWWEFYIPFFYELAESEHLNTFCYYILQSESEIARKWLEDNEDKIEAWDEWFSN